MNAAQTRSRRLILLSGLLAGLPWPMRPAAAQTGTTQGATAPTSGYPDRPVTLVAPFSAGGAADIAARNLAAHAGRHLPNPRAMLVVENRAGASGAVGTQLVQRSPPDGMTLLLARVASAAILPATDPRTPYGWDEFTMLGLLDENPFIIAVRADAPWPGLRDLLQALRERPGTLQFATTGPATILDMGVRQMFAASGLPLDAGIAVPFRGGGDAVASVLAGQTQFIGNNLSDTSAAIASGQLRVLVVGTPERLAGHPDVPTAAEVDLPDLAHVSGWSALFGPPGLPEPVVDAWTAALAALREDAGWLAGTRQVGSIARLLGPAETRRHVGMHVELYRELAKRLGLA